MELKKAQGNQFWELGVRISIVDDRSEKRISF